MTQEPTDGGEVDPIFGIYGDPHRIFMQAMMSRGIIDANEFNSLFNLILQKCGIQPLELGEMAQKQKCFVETVNKVVETKCDLKVRKVWDEEARNPRKSWLILINKTDRSKDSNKLTIKDQVTFTNNDLEYLKMILDQIMENPMRQINSTRALNVARDMNKNNKRYTVQDAEKTLQKFKDHKWLIDGGDPGSIILSTRFIIEMEPFIKEIYANFVGKCFLCKKFVVRSIECSNEDCGCQYHNYCIKSSRCTKCKSVLPDRRQDNGHRREPMTSTNGFGSPEEKPGQKRKKRIQQMHDSSSESD